MCTHYPFASMKREETIQDVTASDKEKQDTDTKLMREQMAGLQDEQESKHKESQNKQEKNVSTPTQIKQWFKRN